MTAKFHSSEPFETVKYAFQLFGIWQDKGTTAYFARKIIFVIVYIVFNTTCFLGFYNELGNGNLEVVCSKMAMLTVGGYASTVLLIHNKKEYQSWLTDFRVYQGQHRHGHNVNRSLSLNMRLKAPDFTSVLFNLVSISVAMLENEKFMNNHPNSKLRAVYRYAIRYIWPKHLFRMNQWALGTAVIIFAIIMAIFVNDKLNHIDECAEVQECNIVLMGYYYFPWDVNEHYWLANMEDVVFGGLCGVFAITRDMCLASYICYLICRLRLLTYVVRHLNLFVDERLASSKNFDVEVDFLLGECVKEHQEIIREFMVLKGNLSKMFFVMLLVHTPAVANITLTIFKGDSTSTFALFVYCAAFYGCTHLYLILSLSEQLSSECLRLATSIHFMNWYELNIKHQKVLKFMLMRAQKPFILTCGTMFPANLATFTKTMRAIYTILNAFINLSD